MSYKVQINDEIRNATPDEIARIEQIQTEAETTEKRIADTTAARATALAKLEALGLSPAEIAALVG